MQEPGTKLGTYEGFFSTLLTTAASMWATAATGVVLGTGHYLLGVLLAVIVVVVLEMEQIPGLRRISVRDGSLLRDQQRTEDATPQS